MKKRLLAIPAAALAGGVGIGYGGRKEKQRWKTFKGPSGERAFVRKGKTKHAFDLKMHYALQATGADLDVVADSFEAELEKIAAGRIATAWKGIKGMFGKAAPEAAETAAKSKNVPPAGWKTPTVKSNAQAAAIDRASAPRPTTNPAAMSVSGRTAANPGPVVGANPGPVVGANPARTPLSDAVTRAEGSSPTVKVAPQTSPVTANPPTSPVTANPPTGPGTGGPMWKAPAEAPGMLQQAKDAVGPGMQRNFGVDVNKGTGQFEGGMSNWFSKLTPEQKLNLQTAGAVGGAGVAGVGGLAAGAALAGGGNTTVYA